MTGRKVIVHEGEAEKALRKFKKQITEIGLLQELRERQEYVKPTTRRKLAKVQAKKRWRKYLRDQELPKKYF